MRMHKQTKLNGASWHGPIFAIICILCGQTVLAVLMQPQSKAAETCNENDLKECAVAADSLVRDPSLVFPDSPSSLDRVCRTWDQFISCIYNFTRKCYTSTQKARFDQSFNTPILSMSTLCRDDMYRQDYLVYAPCIKKITTDGGYCGFQYQMLIDQINSQLGLKQLCCARSKFKNCILTKTKDMCDPDKKGSLMQRPRQVPYGSEKPLNVTAFSIQVLDKSLAFIAQQCSSLGEEECEGLDQNQTILRPNSKGPLTNVNMEDQLQSAATFEKRQPSTATKFNTPPKQSIQSDGPAAAGTGNKNYQSSNLNSIVKPVNPGTNSQGPVGSFNTAQKRDKDKPQQDKLATAGIGGSGVGHSDGSEDPKKDSADRNSLAWYSVLFASFVTLVVGAQNAQF